MPFPPESPAFYPLPLEGGGMGRGWKIFPVLKNPDKYSAGCRQCAGARPLSPNPSPARGEGGLGSCEFHVFRGQCVRSVTRTNSLSDAGKPSTSSSCFICPLAVQNSISSRFFGNTPLKWRGLWTRSEQRPNLPHSMLPTISTMKRPSPNTLLPRLKIPTPMCF